MPAILPKPGNSIGGSGMILERESLAVSEVSHLVNVHPKPIIRLLPAASFLLWKTAPWVINRYFEPAETNPWNWLFQSFLVTVIFHITLLNSHSVGCFYMNCQFLQSCLVAWCLLFYFNFVCHQNFINKDNFVLVLYFKMVGTMKYIFCVYSSVKDDIMRRTMLC